MESLDPPLREAESGTRPLVQGVIFDVDGTLIDSNDAHAQAWAEVFAEFGYPQNFDAIRGQIGKGGDPLMPVFLPPEVLAAQGKAIEERRKALFAAKYLPTLKPFPQVRELFTRLVEDGKRLVLASSASRPEVSVYQRLAEVDDLIEQSTSKDEVARSKPAPDIFAAALAQLAGLSASSVIVVGDSPYDAQAAGQLGLHTVGLLCGGFPESDLRAAGFEAIFMDPADLLARYEQSPLAGRVLA